jgi:hypothetical protein
MPTGTEGSWEDVSFVQGALGLTASWATQSDKSDSANFCSINGAPQADNSFYLDGAPVSTSNHWNYCDPRDSVQEIQANFGSYHAQNGPAAGGSFNQVIKEGANIFHGSVYCYLQNALFAANTYADDLAGVRKPISN